MYRYIKDYELRYTDVDAYDNVKLSSLLSFLEESACRSADELGFGYDAIASHGLGFVVVNWYVKLFKQIKLGSLLTVHTWPLKPKRLIFLRDYELYCGKEMVGVCTARWCMVDVNTISPKPVSSFFDENFFDEYNIERSIDFSAWKIESIASNQPVYSRKVYFTDYDHYFHVNNTKYADFVLDAFSTDELNGKCLTSARITYVKQCKEGETLSFYREKVGAFYVVEGRVDGEVRIQMALEFNNESIEL